MDRRLLVPLGLAVAGLLVVVALAASSHPLGGGGGSGGTGPSPTFLDYVFTTIVIFAVLIGALVLWGLATSKPDLTRKRPGRFRYLGLLLYLLVASLIGWGLASSGFQKRLAHAAQQRQAARQQQPPQGDSRAGKANPLARQARLRWDEVALALALLAAAGVAAYASMRNHRRLPPLPWRTASRQSLSAALDESLDDLRAEPDLRKAIIAAYARMERALAAAGLPRHPAEAPLEYVERTLAELHASAGAARLLTDLFEWAKFSQHEPEPEMRDEAVDALVAVRDELRAPAEEPVAA